MAEVHVTGVWVELAGVPTTQNGLLTVAVSHNGTSSFVRSDNRQSVVFQHQPVPVQIQYSLANPAGSINAAVQQNLGSSEIVYLKGKDAGTTQEFSYVSPFAAWTIAILAKYSGGQQLDLPKVESVQRAFWVQFQLFVN
jgi:hypothetical protein